MRIIWTKVADGKMSPSVNNETGQRERMTMRDEIRDAKSTVWLSDNRSLPASSLPLLHFFLSIFHFALHTLGIDWANGRRGGGQGFFLVHPDDRQPLRPLTKQSSSFLPSPLNSRSSASSLWWITLFAMPSKLPYSSQTWISPSPKFSARPAPRPFRLHFYVF